MITYPAMLSIPDEQLAWVTGLVVEYRRSRASTGWVLDPEAHALLVLVRLRENQPYEQLAAGFGIGTATAYRYVRLVVDLAAAQAPGLTEAVEQAAASGADYAFVDGTAVRIDRIGTAADRAARRGARGADSEQHQWHGGQGSADARARKAAAERERRARARNDRLTEHAAAEAAAESARQPTRPSLNRLYYSGKHKHHAVNLQVLVSAHGELLWISDQMPGCTQDLTAAHASDLFTATAAAGLKLIADLGYVGSGHPHLITGYRKPPHGELAPGYREANRQIASIRATAEHPLAALKQWAILRRYRASPHRAGTHARAIHAITVRSG